jgi:hypothetical protein
MARTPGRTCWYANRNSGRWSLVAPDDLLVKEELVLVLVLVHMLSRPPQPLPPPMPQALSTQIWAMRCPAFKFDQSSSLVFSVVVGVKHFTSVSTSGAWAVPMTTEVMRENVGACPLQ